MINLVYISPHSAYFSPFLLLLYLLLIFFDILSGYSFPQSLSASGTYKFPKPAGEPFKHYARESPERAELSSALRQVRNEIVDVPVVIGGKEYFTNKIVEQVIPSDHQHVIARVHQADESLIKEAIKSAAKARKDWANLPQHHRSMVFKKAGDLISGKYRARMNAVTMLGTGKTAWQAEIDSAVEQIDFLRLSANFAEQVYADQPQIHSPGSWNRVKYRELDGFVAAISPFNFAAIGANLNAAPASVGNTTLWKPSTNAVLENYVSFQIMQEAGLPDGVINFMPSNSKIFKEVFKSPEFAGVHFTGSTAVFNDIWRTIGDNINDYRNYPRVVGETGGKNFHVIHPDADYDTVLHQTVRAAFEYQGQKCSACSRLYVPASAYHDGGFRNKLVELTESLTMGQPDEYSNFMSAVIDKKSMEKHAAAIAGAREGEHTSVIAGGQVDGSRGFFVRPTIIETKDPRSATMTSELFGPILTVYVYEDRTPGWTWRSTLEEVESAVEYGLTGAVFARDRKDLAEAEEVLKQACGNLYLNDKCTGAVVGEQPFGGARKSGTNDKAGSYLNHLRWVSAQCVKETTVPLGTVSYPSMK